MLGCIDLSMTGYSISNPLLASMALFLCSITKFNYEKILLYLSLAFLSVQTTEAQLIKCFK